MKKYLKLRERHEKLVQDVENSLRAKVEKSKTESKHIAGNCLKIDRLGYTELAIIHDDLTWMDSRGLQYVLYDECTLEDLIDILINLNKK